ncbi:hypothetical protein QFC20_002154 [Naganishia adeliensis]|uniref:Uncharacterized protein n=1 Tax=Naganishia adeliensis TaxID=92952 RepID=A0ACC2WPR6_9TREE|nr:hypothetical protein QFC20_002154 [Naganishia adeliensis]
MQKDTNPEAVATSTHEVQDKAARIIQRAYRRSRARSPSPVYLELPVDHAIKGSDFGPGDVEADDLHPGVLLVAPGDAKKSEAAEVDAHTCTVEELCAPHHGELSNMFAVTVSSGHFKGIPAERIAKLCGTSMKPPHLAANYMREEAAARTLQPFFRRAKRAESQMSNV